MRAFSQIEPGDQLGRYEFLLPIARGGMAAVWAARVRGARGFTKMVALKTMLPDFSKDTSFERMFLDEAELASRIHHPNVAQILDLGEEGDRLYIVMEWVDGETLATIMKAAETRGGIPLAIALKICADGCAGLHAAHELRGDDNRYIGLVHRDVSPPNVVVGYDGIVKLVDFGVAKAVELTEGETEAGQVKGKLRYMSPEQLLGTGIDRRTDVFAMGIVLYQLTTGYHPWQAETPLLTAQNVLEQPAPSPRSHIANFPVELESILLRALAHEPAYRFQSAAEMATALEGVAFALGKRASTADVAAYLDGLLGAHGRDRREKLRSAVRDAEARSQGKQPVYASSVSAMSLATEPTDKRVFRPRNRTSRREPGRRRMERTARTSATARYVRLAVSAVLFLATLYGTSALLRLLPWRGRSAARAITCPADMIALAGSGTCIDVRAVTAPQYEACVGAGACASVAKPIGGEDRALAQKKEREMALAYCRWVGKRVPLEGEQELAAGGEAPSERGEIGFRCVK
jgi:serine/threonine protein kinase